MVDNELMRYNNYMGEYRVGWMNRPSNRDIVWDAAEAICESWTVEEIRALGVERSSLFAGCPIPDQLRQDLQLVRHEFSQVDHAAQSRLVHVKVGDNDVFVAEADDEAVILAISRLCVVGALTAAGFDDEF